MTQNREKFEVRPLTAALGAEIAGVDLRSLDDETFDFIHATLLESEVIFIRDTDLDDESQIALAHRFGEPAIFPLSKVMGATAPDIQVIEDGPNSPNESDQWHTDVTWIERPPKIALLRASVVPERGGDTMWASMTTAYEALSPSFRNLCDSLEVHHHHESFLAGVIRKMGSEKAEKLEIGKRLAEAYPGIDHPLVRTHPETKRRSIFYGGGFMRHVNDVTESESTFVLDFLERHIQKPEFHCRWQWRPGDLAIWDERSTLHRAVGDHFPARRAIHRCVVEGDRPQFAA